MSKILFAAVAIFLTISVSAGPATGSLKIASTPGINNRAKCKSNLAAFAVTRNNVTFHWKPAKRANSVLGEAALSDAVISGDGSLLVIAENFADSSRLILFNLISGKIGNAYTFAGRKLVKLAFIPGKKHSLLALHRSNTASAAFLHIDLRSGSILSERKISGSVKDFVCSSSEIFFTTSYQICKAAVDAPESPVVNAMETNSTDGLLALSIDNKVLTHLVSGRVEFYELSRNGLIPMTDISLPRHHRFSWIVPVLPGGTSVIVGREQGAAFIVHGGVATQITALAGPPAVQVPFKQEVIINLAVKDQILRCSLPDCTKIIGVNPRTLRPANYNGTFRVLVQDSDAKNVLLVQIDNRGNIFRINVSNRRSKKELLLLTDNQGVR
ncbi:MAG: hypothetical protein IKD22_05870 [Lentisphaeria bacterium]|nr:hypothetical protein [Lentisphaeria bacterium]